MDNVNESNLGDRNEAAAGPEPGEAVHTAKACISDLFRAQVRLHAFPSVSGCLKTLAYLFPIRNLRKLYYLSRHSQLGRLKRRAIRFTKQKKLFLIKETILKATSHIIKVFFTSKLKPK